jgi:hypothetical protein
MPLPIYPNGLVLSVLSVSIEGKGIQDQSLVRSVPYDPMGPDDLRSYQAYLLKERELAVGAVIARVAALPVVRKNPIGQ